MGFLIPLFTVIMVLDCVVLILLVLIQLPKKDAGAGLAFGGGATDALFGSGSGTVLTKITKYAATIFFVLAILLAVMQKTYHNRGAAQLERSLSQTPPAPPPAAIPTTSATPAPLATPLTTSNAPLTRVEATNLPAAPT